MSHDKCIQPTVSNFLQDNVQEEGLLTQIVSWIFSQKNDTEGDKISKVCVSFVEIYKEEIFDLLSPTLTKIEIKNDKGTLNVEI